MLKNLEPLALDLGDPASIRAAATAFYARHSQLDVLCNIAGAVFFRRKVVAPSALSQAAALAQQLGEISADYLVSVLLIVLGVGIVINLIVAAVIDQNRNWFHYLLIAFITQFVITLHLDINLLSDFVLLLELAGIMIVAIIYKQYLDREEV